MKKYIIIFAVIFGLFEIAYPADAPYIVILGTNISTGMIDSERTIGFNKGDSFEFEVGDFVETNQEYAKLYEGKSIRGTIKWLTDCEGKFRYPDSIARLGNGEQISCFWLKKVVRGCKDCDCNCKCKAKTRWHVNQPVWHVLKGRGTIKEISYFGKCPLRVKFNFQKGYVLYTDWYSFTLDGKASENEAQVLFPIETKRVIYDLDKLFPVHQQMLMERSFEGTYHGYDLTFEECEACDKFHHK